jgi:hypothetical protein
MKNIFTLFVVSFICLTATRLNAEPDTVSCNFFLYSKASVGCHVYLSYQGNAPSSATFTWDFDGGVVVSGSGPGPYYIRWDTAGYKTVSLHVYYQGDYCNSTRNIHIVPPPTVYNVTGGGSYPSGGSGVAIGLSGSQPNYNYYLFLNNGGSSVANQTGTGNALNFGMFTAAGTYTCRAKVDSSSSTCLISMSDSAVVTISGYVPGQYICMVTYDTATQKNKIVWNKTAGQHLTHFNIYKQTYQENVYTKIGEVPYTAFSTFVDTTTNPVVMAQKYELSASDSSGSESAKSPYHKTVHLEVSPGVQGFNLIWNSYEGFTFLTYRIHRKLNTGPWQLIDSIASDQTSYTDPYFTSGIMTYYIEVIRYYPCNPTLKSGEYESIVSNTMSSAPLGIANNQVEKILLYPNPIHGYVTVLLPSQGIVPASLEIYAPDGRKCFEQTLNCIKTEFDLSTLSSGMYFYKVMTREGLLTGKLIRE